MPTYYCAALTTSAGWFLPDLPALLLLLTLTKHQHAEHEEYVIDRNKHTARRTTRNIPATPTHELKKCECLVVGAARSPKSEGRGRHSQPEGRKELS